MRFAPLFVAVSAAATLVTGSARGERPSLTAGFAVAYGMKRIECYDAFECGTHPYGLGWGTSLGVSYWHLYAGGTFAYYAGEHSPLFSIRARTIGGEVGYELVGEHLVIRPSLEVGQITLHRAWTAGHDGFLLVDFGGGSASTTCPYVGPALTVLVPFGGTSFLAGSGRAIVSRGDASWCGDLSATSLSLSGGVRF